MFETAVLSENFSVYVKEITPEISIVWIKVIEDHDAVNAWFHIRSVKIEGWAQDYSNSNIFLKPLFRGNLDPFVNNANLGAIAHTSNGT